MEMNAKNAAECRRDTGLYGNYIKVKVENIPLAKDLMLDNLIATIRELAKREDFFIIKKHEDVPEDPLLQLIRFDSGVAKGEATVAWKIQFPQMKKWWADNIRPYGVPRGAEWFCMGCIG